MIVNQTNVQHYSWAGDCDGWLLLPREDIQIIRERMPPRRAEVCHHHERSRQFFFVLTGRLTMELNGTIQELQCGDGIEIPPGVPHQAKNNSEMETEFLVISHPTTRADRVDHPNGRENGVEPEVRR